MREYINLRVLFITFILIVVLISDCAGENQFSAATSQTSSRSEMINSKEETVGILILAGSKKTVNARVDSGIRYIDATGDKNSTFYLSYEADFTEGWWRKSNESHNLWERLRRFAILDCLTNVEIDENKTDKSIEKQFGDAKNILDSKGIPYVELTPLLFCGTSRETQQRLEDKEGDINVDKLRIPLVSGYDKSNLNHQFRRWLYPRQLKCELKKSKKDQDFYDFIKPDGKLETYKRPCWFYCLIITNATGLLSIVLALLSLLALIYSRLRSVLSRILT